MVSLPAACGGSSDSNSITLYTCASDTTVGPVIDTFEHDHPGTKVDLYRAPTGDLNARVAGDVRSGGLRADVIWACDPLTMQDYVHQGLVGGWTPKTSIPSAYRTPDYVGVAILYVVAVSKKGVPAPAQWSDLTGARYHGDVAISDPAVAASALGALGYFAQNPAYGTGFFDTLHKSGATQVSTPDDVVSGIADDVYAAGITTANSAYAAQKAGSPINVSWPRPGAIAVYGPIGLAKDTKETTTAEAFISYVASRSGQTQMSGLGSYPTVAGVPGPTKPNGAAVVSPNWSKLASDKAGLLAKYQKIFGG
ncbi:MAG: extracellular solute-binding protein [Nocardioides sp.]